MIKKVIDFNRLPKQEYQQPAMEVHEAETEDQLLITSVTSTGLNEPLELNGGTADSWNEAW